DVARHNLGIEPLPDIDFNIRTGNTLVGFATYDEVLKTAEGDWIKQQEIEQLKVAAADLQKAFDKFRAQQVAGDGGVTTDAKRELRARLGALDDKLSRFLATEYGIRTSKAEDYAKWLTS